jgi:hypothetical protein
MALMLYVAKNKYIGWKRRRNTAAVNEVPVQGKQPMQQHGIRTPDSTNKPWRREPRSVASGVFESMPPTVGMTCQTRWTH